MPWRTYSCHFCSGRKHIEIGRNIDNQQEYIEICPSCNGKGYLHVVHRPYDSVGQDQYWKRMMGDGGLI